MTPELNKTHVMRCEDGLALIGRNEIPLTVTSPPYQNLRSYKGYSFNFEETAQHLLRVTVPGGIVCWVIGDSVQDGSETLEPFRQALFFKYNGFSVHDTMIYQKSNFSNPEKTRYHQVFEYVFIMSKGKPRTFNPLKDRKNVSAGKIGSLGVNTCTQVDGSKLIRPRKVNTAYGMRHNVWLGKTRGQEEMCKELKHPAMMPKWLARDLILSWSNPGDVVLDPMMGSGTTAQMAIETGRQYLGFESAPEYVIASW